MLQLTGATMGTRYHISIVQNKIKLDKKNLHHAIKQRLEQINQSMSTYLEDSEISRFNHSRTTNWFPISNDFFHVMKQAIYAYQETQGAFDPSIYPLVSLWGFAKQIKFKPPSEQQIQTALKRTGLQYVKLQSSPEAIAKQKISLALDLSAIAKGYAVDVISEFLLNKGLSNHLVEIGGEIRAHGTNLHQPVWNIAIEHPASVQAQTQVNAVIKSIYLNNQALATSGDYRNFYEYQGKQYAHTLDPKTGYPVQTHLVSITVLHPSSLWADAMATAMMVMGKDKALRFANQKKLAIFMVTYTDKDQYQTLTNHYFDVLTKYP
jgi:thiamine biosynthesis lipoprotein